MSVDHLQIVWTHNCEHGEVRGWPLALAQDRSGQGWTALRAGEDLVQCGPEQLVARLPARWDAGGGPGAVRVNWVSRWRWRGAEARFAVLLGLGPL